MRYSGNYINDYAHTFIGENFYSYVLHWNILALNIFKQPLLFLSTPTRNAFKLVSCMNYRK